MHRKVFLFAILTIFAIGFVFAGTTGKITGHVTDAETGLPLPGANVVVEGSVLGGAADLDGYYAILNVPPGTYNVRATVIGYEAMVFRNVVVKIDLTTTLDFNMRTEAIDMPSLGD